MRAREAERLAEQEKRRRRQGSRRSKEGR